MNSVTYAAFILAMVYLCFGDHPAGKPCEKCHYNADCAKGNVCVMDYHPDYEFNVACCEPDSGECCENCDPPCATLQPPKPTEKPEPTITPKPPTITPKPPTHPTDEPNDSSHSDECYPCTDPTRCKNPNGCS